jgi:hypothetical protein
LMPLPLPNDLAVAQGLSVLDASVPEPRACVLIAAGAAGLLGRRRRPLRTGA